MDSDARCKCGLQSPLQQAGATRGRAFATIEELQLGPRGRQVAELITDAYRAQQSQLHQNPNYGVASVNFAPFVATVMQALNATELLDYGAGKGRLRQALAPLMKWPVQVRHYDPAIPEWAATPEPMNFVTCIDVLEHIEPPLLDNVLDDLQRVTAGCGFFTVHTGPAVKHLADGRNAHLIQQPPAWWLPKLLARFELLQFNRIENGFIVVVQQSARAATGG